MADEEMNESSLSGRSCRAAHAGECRSQVYARGGTAFVIENPFRCTDSDGSSLPSYASPTVASRIRMSMSTDKLATDEMPVCHRYRPPSPLCHSIKDQRSRSVDNGLRKCQAEIQKVSERLSTPRRKESSSSRAKSSCSTPVSVQTPPQLSSPLKSSHKPSVLSSSFTEENGKPPRNKATSTKLGNFATLPSKLKKDADKDEMMTVSLNSGLSKEASKLGSPTVAPHVERQEAKKEGQGLASPNGTNKELSKQKAASTHALPNKESSKQTINTSSKELNRPITTPPNVPNRDLNKQTAVPLGSTVKEVTKQGSAAPTQHVSSKDLEVKQKKHHGTSKSPVPPAAKEAKSRPEKENKGAKNKEKPPAEVELSGSDAMKPEVAKEGSVATSVEAVVEVNTSEAAKEDPAKSKADPAVDEYRARLAEKRRLAREKAEREVEEERKRQEELRLAEEERHRAEEEEQRRREEEELRLAEELRKAEEERFQRMVELEEKRRREEAEQVEADMQAKLEQQRRAKEESEKQEQERQARIRREEEEKLDRKRRLESIMKRVKTDDVPLPKNESVAQQQQQSEDEPDANGTVATDDVSQQKPDEAEKPPKPEGPPTLLSVLNTSVDGTNVDDDKASDSLVPKFKSPLLQQILAGKNKAKNQNSEVQKESVAVVPSAVDEVKVQEEEAAKRISDDVPDGSGQMSTTCA